MESLSFFWKGTTVPEPDRALLMRLYDDALPVEQRKEALVWLLGSDHVAARGVALDYYSMAYANLRHGNEPMIDDAINDAARACAVRELAAQPYECVESEARLQRGANHASALHALWHNATAEDAALLARVLRENDDPQVLLEGVAVAEPVLRGEPAHLELIEVLLQIARNRDVEPRTRAGAIAAIGGVADEAVVPLLAASLADPELAVSAAAARVLLERDLERHRPLVDPVAAAWQTGEFPPFDVHEVRRLLEGDD